jgi:hypothetical protein
MSKYTLSQAQREELSTVKADAEVRSARRLLASGKPRAAFERAGQALSTLGSLRSAVGQQASNLREEALAAGTRYLAIVPFWQTEGFRSTAPDLLREVLNDELQLAEKPAPPLFLEVVDAVDVRRTARQSRSDRKILGRTDMRSLGIELQVDFLSAGELVRLESAEEIVSERRVAVRTTGRQRVDTVFVVQEVNVAMGLRASYRVIEVSSGEIIAQGEIPAVSTASFTRGHYQGDPSTLDLSGNQMQLFDADELERNLIDAEGSLARMLANQTRNAIFEALDGLII